VNLNVESAQRGLAQAGHDPFAQLQVGACGQ